ncbi:DNA helicase, partial [Anoxybacillus flavithermus]
GLEVEDSFFAKEIPIEEEPFRLYSGICVSGHSMKTVLVRVYAVLLQFTENLKDDPEYSKYLDPYRTLIGYFNSIRELGGTVRLLDDDVKKRLQIITNKYKFPAQRYINKYRELTSRIPSYKIPEVLGELEKEMGEGELAVVLATNMIAVGMDVDRLGLMVVTGQPKQTSEYIQASSRVGRKFPGLVITVYNPYRPRDMSHYQNFKGYHGRLYYHVEGTTATPYASRARDRFLHAVAVALLRLDNPELAGNKNA